MKKQSILLFLVFSFSTLHTTEPVDAENMPEFFYLVAWSGLWEKYQESDRISFENPDSPFSVTTFIPLFQGERQLQSYVRRLNEGSFQPYVICTVRTNDLCVSDGSFHTFSKDRFGRYRFNATVIPKKAIIESKFVTEKT